MSDISVNLPWRTTLAHSTGAWKDHQYESRTGSKNNYTYHYSSAYWNKYYAKRKNSTDDKQKKLYDASQVIDEDLASTDADDDMNSIMEDYGSIGQQLKDIYENGSQEDIQAAEYMIAEALKKYDENTRNQLYWAIRNGQGLSDDDASKQYLSDKWGSEDLIAKGNSSSGSSGTTTEKASSAKKTTATTKTASKKHDTISNDKNGNIGKAKTYKTAQKMNTKNKAGHIEYSAAPVVTYYWDDDCIIHSGIQGMKWGIRRYQNEDGSLTPEGRERYGVKAAKDYYKEHKITKKRDKTNSFEEAQKLSRKISSTKTKRDRLEAQIDKSDINEGRRKVATSRYIRAVAGTSVASVAGAAATIAGASILAGLSGGTIPAFYGAGAAIAGGIAAKKTDLAYYKKEKNTYKKAHISGYLNNV